MDKFKIIFLSVFFVSFSVQAGYVRKLKEPVFFIPEGERMHLQEKLPPIGVSKKEATKKRENKKEENFKEVPEYKKKYDNYLEDVDVFVKTGKMPENEALENDLKAMESDEVFEVTKIDSQLSETEEQKKFKAVLDEIVKD